MTPLQSSNNPRLNRSRMDSKFAQFRGQLFRPLPLTVRPVRGLIQEELRDPSAVTLFASDWAE